MRSLLMCLMALPVVAGSALAQIAAPSLNPTPTPSLTPLVGVSTTFNPATTNPAVLSWDGPSRIAASYGTAEIRDFVIPGVNPAAKGHANGFLLEYVGETFAAAAQTNKSWMVLDPFLGGGSLETKVQQVGAAIQFGKRVSIGIGHHSVENTNQNVNSDLQQTTPMVGATLRLAELIHIGIAAGTETVKDKVGQEQVKRNSLHQGIGVLWRDKDRGIHAELYRSKLPARQFPSLLPATADENISGATLEVKFAGVLLGFNTHTNRTANSGADIAKNTVTTTTLGYALSPGLALVATRYGGKSVNSATGTTNFRTVGTNVGVGYLF